MDAAKTLPGERYYYCFEDPDESINVDHDHRDRIEKCSVPSLESYGDESAARQRKVDWIMGVFLPMICFYFDPIVFRSGFGDDGLLSDYRLPAYVLAFSAIMAQAAWLLWGERLGWLRSIIGFVLLSATVAALLIGLVLFPISVLGIMFLIGLLGFTPFFAAMVYWRTARKALGG